MAGLYGQGNGYIGVQGRSETESGVFGYSNRGYAGVYGHNDTNIGVFGLSPGNIGIHGKSDTNTGVFGLSATGSGVHGHSDRNVGVRAEGNPGLIAFSESGVGVDARGLAGGVIGRATGTGSAGLTGITERPDIGLAGDFVGDVRVTGRLLKGGGGFRIDHPVAPAERYLNHSFVESDKMKNVYDGVARLGTDGTASVELPEWCEALNEDFCYQLTAVGGAAPNLHVAEEISENRFKIAGGKEGMKVCWQVTGTRKDAWAAANPVEVEEEKPQEERGRYLHPNLYNEPEERRVRIGPAEPPQTPQTPPSFEPPRVPEPPPSYVFGMEAELRQQIDDLRQQIEELRRRRKR